MALVKEVGVKFTCGRVAVDEDVGHGGGENGRYSRGATMGAGVSQCAGGVAHAVDAYWRWQFRKVGDVFLLVGLDMVAVDG